MERARLLIPNEPLMPGDIMSTKKILFATDFSVDSNSVAHYANSLARDHDAELFLIHVVEPPPPVGVAAPYGGASIDQNDILLTTMLEEYAEPDVQHEPHLLVGDPATEIVRFAKDEKVDMIVIGTHGRSGLTRLLMGSVAEAVMRTALCPVLTVKRTDKVLAGEEA